MAGFSENLQHIVSCADKRILFTARDIPIFYLFRFPELASFKMFFWLKTIIRDPAYATKRFHFKVLPDEVVKNANKLWKLYSSVPCVEIWSDEAINETLKQIEFCYECGYFENTGDASFLCEKFSGLLHMLKAEARLGQKEDKAAFHLYRNELLIANNTILAERDNKQIAFVNYNTLSLLTTIEKSFCTKTEVYINNLIKNSVLISASAEKERNLFFNKMNERIVDLTNKLKRKPLA